jgi:hypothetical protein
MAPGHLSPSRFNHKHKLFGHLFSGRYKALPVDGSGNGYLKSVCDYVTSTRFGQGCYTPEQPLQDYRWSSYHALPLTQKRRAEAQVGCGHDHFW